MTKSNPFTPSCILPRGDDFPGVRAGACGSGMLLFGHIGAGIAHFDRNFFHRVVQLIQAQQFTAALADVSHGFAEQARGVRCAGFRPPGFPPRRRIGQGKVPDSGHVAGAKSPSAIWRWPPKPSRQRAFPFESSFTQVAVKQHQRFLKHILRVHCGSRRGRTHAGPPSPATRATGKSAAALLPVLVRRPEWRPAAMHRFC